MGFFLEAKEICCFLLCCGGLRWEGVNGWLTDEETGGVKIWIFFNEFGVDSWRVVVREGGCGWCRCG